MKTKNESTHKLIVFYDGYCRVCNWWTSFVIKRDRYTVFEFHPISSAKADQFFVLNQSLKRDAIVVWDQQNSYWIASHAIFKIVRYLKGFPRILILFKILPIRLNDWIYYLVARNRYRFFKKSDSCRIHPQ